MLTVQPYGCASRPDLEPLATIFRDARYLIPKNIRHAAIVTNSTLPPAVGSRFFKRWLAADPGRTALIDQHAGLSLTRAILAELLQKDTDNGLELPAAMRRLRNLVICILIQRDLTGLADLDEVMRTMTAFADFAVQTLASAIHRDMVALHGTPVGEESAAPMEMIVLGMGKLGGGELNVSSDIDLIFVYGEEGNTQIDTPLQRQLSNHEFFTRLGKRLIAALSEITGDGFVFRVDMALRPNGASGPLAASLAMLEEYFVVQGREWERYAWVKARALTGNQSDLVQLEALIRPFVYRRYLDFGSIDAIRNMHAQIRAEVVRQETRHPDRSNNIKLGRGGIREIEFLAQVFQLIRGGREAPLRDRSTRNILRTLLHKQLMEAPVVEGLLDAYTFLRNLEHRLQYVEDAQTHALPPGADEQRHIAGMMGYADVGAFLTALELHRRFVAAQFDAIFRDKSGAANRRGKAGDPAAPLALSDTSSLKAITARLVEMQFTEAERAAQRLHASLQSPRMQMLPEVSRNRLLALINAALPLIARNTGSPAATLARLLDFFEAIARRAAYLALLTEYPHALERVIRMMSASDWAAKYLTLHPLLLDELLDDLALQAEPDWHAFAEDCRHQLAAAAGDTERQMDVLRELHHAQLLCLLAQDLEGNLSVEHLADHLSRLADILVAATMQAAWETIANRHREVPLFSVIAYGKLGGKELGYASDLDVIFLYRDDHPEAPALYAKLAQRFITWMTAHTPAGILFDVDTALRPDGASGLLVSSLSSFEKYQAESAWLWEHQALTRARFCAGDADIGARFESIRESVLRRPREVAELKREVLAMRRKMHDAHPNRSELFDLKHDEGGMIDIEFIVQFLILAHAATFAQLTADIGNIALLRLCGELGLIDAQLAGATADAYRTFRKLQHQIRLQGADRARVERKAIENERNTVRQLWHGVMD